MPFSFMLDNNTDSYVFQELSMPPVSNLSFCMGVSIATVTKNYVDR